MLPPPRCMETTGVVERRRDARQSAGHHDPGISRGRQIDAQNDAARRERVVRPDGRGREVQQFLADEIRAAGRRMRVEQLRALVAGELAAENRLHALATGRPA